MQKKYVPKGQQKPQPEEPTRQVRQVSFNQQPKSTEKPKQVYVKK
jgi:hypothetical protein